MTSSYRNRIHPANLLFVSCLLLGSAAYGQQYQHYTVWSRIQVQKRFTKRFELTGEYHYRQQNDFHDAVQTPLDRPLTRAFRLIGNYRKGAWSFQLNPSYFLSYQLIGKEEDYTVPTNAEWRFAAYTEWARTWKRFTFRVRPGYEYRFQERNNYAPTGRARLRVQGRFALGKRVRWLVADELLLNVGPNAAPLLFNQNQASMSLDFDLYEKWLGLEVGYMNIYRQRRTRVEFDDEHALGVQLKIRL